MLGTFTWHQPAWYQTKNPSRLLKGLGYLIGTYYAWVPFTIIELSGLADFKDLPFFVDDAFFTKSKKPMKVYVDQP